VIIQTINREHPEYTARKATWRRYRDLYAGGDQLRDNGSEYLVRRQKEPGVIYQERLVRLFYQNYIGSIIDWYAATLMHREPVVTLDQSGVQAGGFYNAFLADCDLKGSRLSQFFRERFIEMLVCGSSHVVVDFPRVAGHALTRAEEDASGQSRAFLVNYGPDEIINWNRDDHGGLDWIVIRSSCLKQSKVTDPKWEKETRWIYYDRENFQIYRKAGESSPVELVDAGRHCLAPFGRVPVFEMKVTEGLWLMNKAALLQLEHFNKSNALSWALTMGLFAMPVVYSDKDFQPVVGESYYVQLGKEDRFGWTEPEGKVYQIAADNLVALKDEIYRVCYLMNQAGSASGTGAHQSGLSKQLDFSTTEEVLRAYGAVVKEIMTLVLQAVAAARQDEISIGVTGLDDFDIDEFGTELDDAKKLLQLGIGSPTLAKQVFKRLALKYLSDARPEIKNQVAEEIEQMDYAKTGGITDPALR
jgi:hypothetical protein